MSTYSDQQQSLLTLVQPMCFTCCICQANTKSQFEFFEHLKAHYGDGPSAATATDDNQYIEISENTSLSPISSSVSQFTDSFVVTFVELEDAEAEANKEALTNTHYFVNASQLVELYDQSPTETRPTNSVSKNHNGTPQRTMNACKLCTRVFTRKFDLKRHVGGKHPYEEYPLSDNDNKGEDEDDVFAEKIRKPPSYYSIGKIHNKDLQERINNKTPSNSSKHMTKQRPGAQSKSVLATIEQVTIIPDLIQKVSDPEDTSLDEGSDGVDQAEGYMCCFCGETFSDRIRLTKHELKCHTSNNSSSEAKPSAGIIVKKCTSTIRKRYKCQECLKIFNHRNSLLYHKKSVHSLDRPYACKECTKTFRASSALKCHIRLHTGAKPYKCKDCDCEFRQGGDLQCHIISLHSGIRAYKCEYCGNDFARKYSLTIHRRIHTGERNYNCGVCEMSFRASCYLQEHKRTHTGEKPHACAICGKAFVKRSDMTRHVRSHTEDFLSAKPSSSKREKP